MKKRYIGKIKAVKQITKRTMTIDLDIFYNKVLEIDIPLDLTYSLLPEDVVSIWIVDKNGRNVAVEYTLFGCENSRDW